MALFQQLIHLRILGGFGHGRGLEASLVAARFALVAGVPLAMAIAPNLVAASFGAKMLCVNHNGSYGFHPYSDHRQRVKILPVKRLLKATRSVFLVVFLAGVGRLVLAEAVGKAQEGNA
jgi:hypothetical protein